MKLNRLVLFFLGLFLASQPARADLCARLKEASAKLQSYQCTYHAVTSHEGKRSETRMLYSFQQPKKIRMDIEIPSKGAVLLYNTDVTDQVRVRPFPKMKFFVLKYPLTHKRVSTDSGGTIDRSDIISRVEALCKEIERLVPEEKKRVEEEALIVKDGRFSVSLPEGEGVRRWGFDSGNLFLKVIEVADGNGKVLDRFAWEDLKVNPEFSKDFFKEFQ